MEVFKHYGELEKIAKGEGELFLKSDKSFKVTFEIAKRGEEKLLFNAICDGMDAFSTIELFDFGGIIKLIGSDSKGRQIEATELLIKDTQTNNNGNSTINGYVQKCEIGQKIFDKGYEAHFHLINFLFEGNETKVEKTEKGTKYSSPTLQLTFPDFECRIEKAEDFRVTKELLKRQGGVLKTSFLKVDADTHDDFEFIHEKVRKLCQLLSVARSTFINWSSCQIINPEGESVYELHGNAITRSYHGNNLINIFPKQTVNFLDSGWKAYDQYGEIFQLKRFLNGYFDTYVDSFIESRSLSIAVLVDFLCSKWALKEERHVFLDEKVFKKNLSKLEKGISTLLEILFDNLKDSYKKAMLSKIVDFNNRPLDWKLKRFRKTFDCPITDKEIKRFIKIRNSLAHRSLFPDDVDSTKAYLFMRHFLDRIVLKILGYKGQYFDIEHRSETHIV